MMSKCLVYNFTCILEETGGFVTGSMHKSHKRAFSQNPLLKPGGKGVDHFYDLLQVKYLHSLT